MFFNHNQTGYIWRIGGPGNNQLTLYLLRAHYELPGDIEVRIRKDGGRGGWGGEK